MKEEDVKKILDWEKNQADEKGVEVPFKPARVILQVRLDFFFFFVYLTKMCTSLFSLTH